MAAVVWMIWEWLKAKLISIIMVVNSLTSRWGLWVISPRGGGTRGGSEEDTVPHWGKLTMCQGIVTDDNTLIFYMDYEYSWLI